VLVADGNARLKLSDDDIYEIKDTASFFAELAVCDYFFTTLRPSTVALASILNALEGVLTTEAGPVTVQVLEGLRPLGFPMNRQEVTVARNRLWELYERSEECALQMDAIVEEESAVNVSYKKSPSMQALVNSPVSVLAAYKHSDSFPSAMPVETNKPLRNESW
jgi:hypothetical protein